MIPIISLASITILPLSYAQVDFAGNLASCVAESSPLNVCLEKTLEDLRGRMPFGIKELDLPPTDPMHVDQVTFKQASGPVSIESNFLDVTVTGLQNFRTQRIEADTVSKLFNIELHVPKMKIVGNYEVNGTVIVFPLEGHGAFFTDLQGVKALGSSRIKERVIDGKRVLQVDQTSLDFTIDHVAIQMNNLFNGESPELAQRVNDFLNKKGQDVLNEVKPEMTKQLAEFVTRVINDAFSKIPADDLLSTLNSRSARSGFSSFSPSFQPQPNTRFRKINFTPNRERSGKRLGIFGFLNGYRRF